MKQPSITAIVGDELRITRLRAKITQEKLAECAGVERSLISDLERGTSNPSFYFFLRLAIALGVEPDQLLSRIWTEYTSKGGRLDDLPAGVKPRGSSATKPLDKKVGKVFAATRNSRSRS